MIIIMADPAEGADLPADNNVHDKMIMIKIISIIILTMLLTHI